MLHALYITWCFQAIEDNINCIDYPTETEIEWKRCDIIQAVQNHERAMTINVYCRLKFTKPKQCHPISLGPRGYTLFKKKKSCVLFLVVPKAKQKFSLLLINPKVIPSLLRFLRKDFFFWISK